MSTPLFRIAICRGPECGDRRGANSLGSQCEKILDAAGLRSAAEITWQSCFGHCTQGPNVLVRELSTLSVSSGAAVAVGNGFATLPGPRGVTALYNRVDVDRLEVIVGEHIGHRRIVRDYIERPVLSARAAVKDVGDSK
jgi:(2Fe-2S) ferredoxin